MDKKKDLDLDGIEFEELEDGYDSIPKESWKDKSFVLETVKQDGVALRYADKPNLMYLDKSIGIRKLIIL